MTAALQVQPHWVDIVPPAAPPPAGGIPALLWATAVVLVLAALAVIYYRRLSRQRSKRALRRIADDLRRARIEAKPACFKVEACLRDGFERRRLDTIRWAHGTQAEWRAYLLRLERCCYAAEPPSPAELDGVIREALVWLNKKRSRADAVVRA